MSLVVDGLVPQMAHSFSCNRDSGTGFPMVDLANNLTNGIVLSISIYSIVSSRVNVGDGCGDDGKDLPHARPIKIRT